MASGVVDGLREALPRQTLRAQLTLGLLAVLLQLGARDDIAVDLADNLFHHADVSTEGEESCAHTTREYRIPHMLDYISLVPLAESAFIGVHLRPGFKCIYTTTLLGPSISSASPRYSSTPAAFSPTPPGSGSFNTPAGVNCAPSCEETSVISLDGSIFEPG